MKKEGGTLPKGVRFHKGAYEIRRMMKGVNIYVRNTDLDALLTEFEKKVEEVQAGLAMQTVFPTVGSTLNDFFEYWFDNAKVLELKGKGSAKVTKRKFKRTFSFYIGYKPVRSILPMDIQAAVNAMDAANVGISTILDAFGLLRQCFDFAVANRIAPTNPCEAVILPKDYAEANPEEVYLTEEEEKLFLKLEECCWYQELFQFMFATGVRVGEVGGLLWSDIDFEKQVVHICHNLECTYVDGEKIQEIYTPKTGYSIRTLPFDMGAWNLGEILNRQRAKTEVLKKTLGKRWRSTEDVVFVTSMGSLCTRYNVAAEINRVLTRFQKGAYGIDGTLPKFHPHSIRHTFATRCAEKGVDVKVAYKLLGHSSITITMEIYQHVAYGLKLAEVKKLGNEDVPQNQGSEG